MEQAVLKSKSQAMIIRLPVSTKKTLDKIQKKSNKSLNKLVLDAILEFISKEK